MISAYPQMSPLLKGAVLCCGRFAFLYSSAGFFVHATTGLQNDKSPTLLSRGWAGLFAEAVTICQAILVLHDSSVNMTDEHHIGHSPSNCRLKLPASSSSLTWKMTTHLHENYSIWWYDEMQCEHSAKVK